MSNSVNIAAAMMGEPVTAPAEVRPIEVITAEIQVLKSQVAVGFIEIGNRLLEAKSQLSHGEWLPWLENQVQFSTVQAQRFMRLAKEYSNTSTLTYLGASKALALLVFSPDEREEFVAEAHMVNGEEKTADEMSVRELEQAIRERKEALEAKERAEAEQQAAEQARGKMAQDMLIANERIECLNETTAHLDTVIADLRAELVELRKQPIDAAFKEIPAGDVAPDDDAMAEALEAARRAGAEDAAKTARKDAEEKLKAKIEKAEKAKADAEAQVQTVKASQAASEAKAAALEKQLKLVSNPIATEFKVHFDAMQKSAASMDDCLDRLAASDADLYMKFTSALAALGEKLGSDAADRLAGKGAAV